MKKALIYGVKSKDNLHYIGKTNKNVNVNGEIKKYKIQVQYNNPPLRDIFQNYENITIEPITLISEENWYPEKLKEVVKQALNKQPLLNAQWMIEGKRGYWDGKKRDENTLLMLSQSKYKQYAQYDKSGNLVKIWKSGKDVAINVFNDYKIVNGSANSSIYRLTKNSLIQNRFKHNSYWFQLKELIIHFNGIPQKLNILNLIKEENIKKSINRKASNRLFVKKYTVEQFDKTSNDLITIFMSCEEAAYNLKLHKKTIRLLCTNKIATENFELKYGEKLLQPLNIKYPEYKINSLIKIKTK